MRLSKALRRWLLGEREMNLIGLNELVDIDRWTLERRSRALAHPVYVGEAQALTRILGRYKFYVSTRDVGFGAHVLLDGCWESWLTVFMARRVAPGMRVVDAGANHGYYTLMFADLVGPSGRVAAFEPNPHLAALLRKSVTVNGFAPRVEMHELALSDLDGGSIELHASADEPKNGVIAPAGSGGVAVRSATLATALEAWPHIDFLKIDVEGAEEAVLAGAWPLINRDLPTMVLEFNVGRSAGAAALLDRLEALYGPAQVINHDGEAEPAERSALLNPARLEDWLLYFARG